LPLPLLAEALGVELLLGGVALLLDDADSDEDDAPLPLMLVSSNVPAVVPDWTQPVSFDDLLDLSIRSADD